MHGLLAFKFGNVGWEQAIIHFRAFRVCNGWHQDRHICHGIQFVLKVLLLLTDTGAVSDFVQFVLIKYRKRALSHYNETGPRLRDTKILSKKTRWRPIKIDSQCNEAQQHLTSHLSARSCSGSFTGSSWFFSQTPTSLQCLVWLDVECGVWHCRIWGTPR